MPSCAIFRQQKRHRKAWKKHECDFGSSMNERDHGTPWRPLASRVASTARLGPDLCHAWRHCPWRRARWRRGGRRQPPPRKGALRPLQKPPHRAPAGRQVRDAKQNVGTPLLSFDPQGGFLKPKILLFFNTKAAHMFEKYLMGCMHTICSPFEAAECF